VRRLALGRRTATVLSAALPARIAFHYALVLVRQQAACNGGAAYLSSLLFLGCLRVALLAVRHNSTGALPLYFYVILLARFSRYSSIEWVVALKQLHDVE